MDALCIIQDSDADWIEQYSLIADIYQNCYVTLCATAALSDNGGCYKRMLDSLQPLKRDGLEYNVYIRYSLKEKHFPSWNDIVKDKQISTRFPLILKA
jgi:hypothetical protein